MTRADVDVVVVGVGNPLRGDDAVGPRVASLLRDGEGVGAEVVEHSGEAAGLLELIAGADSIILVDAMLSGAEPGTVRRFDVAREPLPARAFRCSTHDFGLVEAIELGRALGLLPGRIIVFGIEGETFEAGASLSPAVEQAIECTARRVTDELRALGARASRPLN